MANLGGFCNSEPSDNHVITTLPVELGIQSKLVLRCSPVEPLLDSMIRIVSNLLLRPVGNRHRHRHLTSTPFLFSV
jgi:hypothetical protein